jgi:hypothetical protein
MPPLHRGAVLTLAGALVTGLCAPAASAAADAVARPAAQPAASAPDRPAAPAASRLDPERDSSLAAPVRAAVLAKPRDRVGAKAARKAAAPRCDAKQTPGKRAPYEGRSASKVYDTIFRSGPRIPHLGGHVPQGLASWRNWNGRGGTLLLLGMYRDRSPSYLVGIDPTTGKHVGTLRTKATHFGALGVSRGWLIAQDNATPAGGPAVRRYRLSKVRAQMLRAAAADTKPYLAAEGKPQRVYGASFMAVHEGSVWIGRHVKRKPDSMYRYTVTGTGRLKKEQGPWRVPVRTQGVLVTDKHFVFTSSAGGKRGKLTVVRRAAPKKPVACVWTPSLPQNMTTVGGRIYTAYESGAGKFDQLGAANRIKSLHMGTMRSLNAVLH